MYNKDFDVSDKKFFSSDHDSVMRADQDIHVTFDGDNTVLKQQVAKDLLDQYKHQFSRGRFTGMLSFIGARVRGRCFG